MKDHSVRENRNLPSCVNVIALDKERDSRTQTKMKTF